MLKLNERYLTLKEEELLNLEPYIQTALNELKERKSPGSDFLDWYDWPEKMEKSLVDEVLDVKRKVEANSDVLVSIGIGGSYLGTKAIFEALRPAFSPKIGKVELLFAGQNLSADYMEGLLQYLKDKDFSLNVISKSGTTTEPALAFRLLRDELISRYGEEALPERCFITTDKERGALKQFADEQKLKTFVVPDAIGGRYSVLTAVGLLPLAVAGVDVKKLLEGAHKAYLNLTEGKIKNNPAMRYAAIRNLLYRRGYVVESLVTFEPELSYLAEWWKQLFGESEGKDGKGLLPTSMQFTRDLHSLGQYVQDGRSILMETCLSVEEQEEKLLVEEDAKNLDGLNYLTGKSLNEVNSTAKKATLMAHAAGGVPVLELSIQKRDAESLGYLIYFYELSCALSARLMGVNPFDQPGVEAYKKNMFALLGKPGFEALREELLSK